MPGTGSWTAYRIRVGVMATDADDAARHAIAAQQQSAAIESLVEQVTAVGEPRTDKPGVTRRGYPAAVA